MTRAPYWISDALHDGRQNAARTYDPARGASRKTWGQLKRRSAIREALRSRRAQGRMIAHAAETERRRAACGPEDERPVIRWPASIDPDTRAIVLLRARGCGFEAIQQAVCPALSVEAIRSRYHRTIERMRPLNEGAAA